MLGWLRLLSSLRTVERLVPAPGTYFYQNLDGVRIDRRPREEIIIELCRGKNVLHFGFTDAPLTRERLAGGNLLHSRISAVARYAYGADIDEPAMSLYRELTGDDRYSRLDIESGDEALPAIDARFDIIVFGETLEHLRNPGVALARLRDLTARNPGCVLCTTVPNAFSAMGFVAATSGVEIVHPEHYSYYSPVTLRNILAAHGFSDIAITLCSYQRQAFTAPGITHDCVLATANARSVTNLVRGALASP